MYPPRQGSWHTNAVQGHPHVGPPSAMVLGRGGVHITKMKLEPRSAHLEHPRGADVLGPSSGRLTAMLAAASPTPQVRGSAPPLSASSPPAPPRPSLPWLHSPWATLAIYMEASKPPTRSHRPLAALHLLRGPGPGTACPSSAETWACSAVPPRLSLAGTLLTGSAETAAPIHTPIRGSPMVGCAPCAPAALQSHPRHRKGWDKPVGQPGGLGMETGATHGAGTHRRRPRGSHTNPPPKPGSWFLPCVGDQAWACIPLGRRPSADGTCPRPWDPPQGPLPQSVPWQACVQTDLPFPRALDTHTAHEECTLGQKPAQGAFRKIKYTRLFEGDTRVRCKAMLGVDLGLWAPHAARHSAESSSWKGGGGDMGKVQGQVDGLHELPPGLQVPGL